jgi:hypothetical protein
MPCSSLLRPGASPDLFCFCDQFASLHFLGFLCIFLGLLLRRTPPLPYVSVSFSLAHTRNSITDVQNNFFFLFRFKSSGSLRLRSSMESSRTHIPLLPVRKYVLNSLPTPKSNPNAQNWPNIVPQRHPCIRRSSHIDFQSFG